MSASETAGYSAKPAWQKLGLKPGIRSRVEAAPDDYAAFVGIEESMLNRVGPRASFDWVHLFCTDAAVLRKRLADLATKLPATGVAWVSWPKKSSGVATTITEDTIREVALPMGLVDIKVCAIDAIWSGLKLVSRKDAR